MVRVLPRRRAALLAAREVLRAIGRSRSRRRLAPLARRLSPRRQPGAQPPGSPLLGVQRVLSHRTDALLVLFDTCVREHHGRPQRRRRADPGPREDDRACPRTPLRPDPRSVHSTAAAAPRPHRSGMDASTPTPPHAALARPVCINRGAERAATNTVRRTHRPGRPVRMVRHVAVARAPGNLGAESSGDHDTITTDHLRHTAPRRSGNRLVHGACFDLRPSVQWSYITLDFDVPGHSTTSSSESAASPECGSTISILHRSANTDTPVYGTTAVNLKFATERAEPTELSHAR